MSRCPLVEDLIPEILALDIWWPRDLFRLALISPAWLFYVRKLLYSKPNLRSFSACTRFARGIQYNTHLQSLIKGIELCPTSTDGSRCFGAEEMRAIRLILGLDGLQSITLGGEMAVCAERFLNCLEHSHSIEELTIDGSLLTNSLSARPSFEWDEVMACKFSAVHKVRFAHLELDILYTSTTYQLQLTDLILENVDVISGNLPWLLQGTTTLKHLRVLGESSRELDEQVTFVLENYCLESLHYQVGTSPSWNLVLFDRSLASAASLRSLHLDGVRVDSEMLRTIHDQCPMMEQLYISGRFVPLTRDEWAGCIASGLFPALQKLRVPEGTFFPPFIKWTASLEPALQMACSRRGVHLLG
ncbi:hypothetical protein J3R30DRAFT_3446280 [Lentinula aciculospora]|uniref:Uncharacterized protein n=1 Tax=Lentinula aciculospora TaxID=153920 RepID=A0A9W9AMC6_9AGAR|nr:hypothetical protein J3R30DRAFT_3446280 [Lentinula aciculospora]